MNLPDRKSNPVKPDGFDYLLSPITWCKQPENHQDLVDKVVEISSNFLIEHPGAGRSFTRYFCFGLGRSSDMVHGFSIYKTINIF